MPEPLAADFPSVTLDEWQDAATKGKADVTPASTTDDGLSVAWLYTREDALAPDPGGVPGRAPFVRGVGSGSADVPWEIRQEQAQPDRQAARAAILEDLEGGVTAIELRLDRAAREGHAPGSDGFAATRGHDGVMVSTVDDLEQTLDGTHLDLAPIALEGGAQGVATAALLLALLRRQGIDPATARGSLRIDPLGTLAATGALGEDPADAIRLAGRIAREVADSHPQVRALAVDTRPYVNAGASAARELAIAIATGIAYLRAADEAGLEPARAASQIEFTLAVGPDQFQEIAKLRAVRRLWARVLELSGVPEDGRRSTTLARTSDRMLAGIDPWSNMLRATTAGFAAAVGGAEGLGITPFDTVVVDAVGGAGSSGLGRRIARNTQLILQDEVGVRRVADPAGGSWYVESLTDALAHAAWERIQRTEAAGGALAELQSGRWATELGEQAAARESALARRQREMTGVNVFPLLGDDKVHPERIDRERLAAHEATRLAERPALADGVLATPPADGPLLAALVDAADAGARIDELVAMRGAAAVVDAPGGLAVHRDAAPFEALRRAAAASSPSDADGSLDATAVDAGGPRVFLACLGPLAGHAAAATWAQNFFGVGGLAAIQSDPLDDPAAAAAALTAAPTPLAAVCFGRDEQDERLAATVSALRKAGAQVVYLVQAGDDRATASGADRAIRDGVDMIRVLGDALAATGTTGTAGSGGAGGKQRSIDTTEVSR